MEKKPEYYHQRGPNAKWYLKRCPENIIDTEVEKQRRWRDISRSTMWIVVWDNI